MARITKLNDSGDKMLKNYGGLLKKRRGYHFLNSSDLIRYFIEQHYPDACVVVLLDCRTAFTSIPKLNILKRDDYSTYMYGLINDYVIIEFSDAPIAEDYVFGFPAEVNLRYLIYKNAVLIRDEKGKVN